MTQRVFLKLEKCMACDLKPGDLFVETDEGILAELNGEEPAIIVMLKNNVESDDETIMYRLHLTVVDREEPLPPRVDPHAPPGVKG